MGAPTGWTLNITDATLSAGAGFVVAIAGSMMLMPGLGKIAAGAQAGRGRQRQRHRHGLLMRLVGGQPRQSIIRGTWNI